MLPVVVALMAGNTIALVNWREQWLAGRGVVTIGTDQGRVRAK